jgi:hypothetical protein
VSLSAPKRSEIEMLLARARIERERREEERQKQLRGPPLAASTGAHQPIDQFKEAAERLYARQAYEAQVMAQLAAELEAQAKLVHTLRRAREILGAKRFETAMAESRRRRRAKR